MSGLVKRYLLALGPGKSDGERLKREERALRERISEFRAADRLPRDAVHDGESTDRTTRTQPG